MDNTAWNQGEDTKLAEVVCCPRCGSVDVRFRERLGESIGSWLCLAGDCGKRWRRVFTERHRAHLFIKPQ